MPHNFALGRNDQGEWCTTKLKEYPPAMCGALAESLVTSLQNLPFQAVQDPQSDLTLWQQLNATAFRQNIGPEFAG